MWVLAQPPYSPQGHGRQSPSVELVNQRGYTTWRGEKPRKPVSSKAGRTSETAGAFHIHPRKPRITRASWPPNNWTQTPPTPRTKKYILLPLLLLLRNNLSRQHSKILTISLERQEKRKDRKIRKSKSEEKVVGFSSAYLFSERKRKAVSRVETEKR